MPAPPGPGDFPSLSLASSLLSGLASGPASRGRRESAEPSAWHSAIGSNRPTYRLLQMLHIVRIREFLARQEPRSVDMLFPLFLPTALGCQKERIKGILVAAYIKGAWRGQSDLKCLVDCAHLIVYM